MSGRVQGQQPIELVPQDRGNIGILSQPIFDHRRLPRLQSAEKFIQRLAHAVRNRFGVHHGQIRCGMSTDHSSVSRIIDRRSCNALSHNIRTAPSDRCIFAATSLKERPRKFRNITTSR